MAAASDKADTGREDVLHKEIVLASELAGRTDTSWARERAALWNAAEHAGGRRNARLAREVLVKLPPELGQAQRTELARTFARQLARPRSLKAQRPRSRCGSISAPPVG